MALEAAVAALTDASNLLTGEVTGQLGNIQAAVVQAQTDVTTFIQTGAASFPVTPNLMPDTKKFTNLCGGALNTILPWDGGGAGAPWNPVFQASTGTCDIEVVYAADVPRLTALGIYPLGELEALVKPFPHPTLTDFGIDSHIAIFDVTITDWTYNPIADVLVPFLFFHDTLAYTSWFLDNVWRTQLSYFINILSVDGLELDFGNQSHGEQTRVGLGAPETPHTRVGANIVGQGWKHVSGSRSGFGGFNSTSLVSVNNDPITALNPSHMKFAIALPYQGYGDHQGLPIWAGAGGRWDVNDSL